jgi:hypothetical protein
MHLHQNYDVIKMRNVHFYMLATPFNEAMLEGARGGGGG